MKAHDAIEQAYKNGYAKGEWDMFDLISSAFYGKRCYFLEKDGRVYSRESHEYMTMASAVEEFLGMYGEE